VPSREQEAIRLLRELRKDQPHSFAASTYRSGQWRHQGCSRCAIEERVDLFLKGKSER
jgi:hypothetical protein